MANEPKLKAINLQLNKPTGIKGINFQLNKPVSTKGFNLQTDELKTVILAGTYKQMVITS